MKRLPLLIPVLQVAFVAVGCGGAASSTGAGGSNGATGGGATADGGGSSASGGSGISTGSGGSGSWPAPPGPVVRPAAAAPPGRAVRQAPAAAPPAAGGSPGRLRSRYLRDHKWPAGPCRTRCRAGCRIRPATPISATARSSTTSPASSGRGALHDAGVLAGQLSIIGTSLVDAAASRSADLVLPHVCRDGVDCRLLREPRRHRHDRVPEGAVGLLPHRLGLTRRLPARTPAGFSGSTE